MEDWCKDLYNAVDVEKFQDVHLQTMWEHCVSLEEYIRDILEKLPAEDRDVIELYMDMRNELEYESVKTALRWAKQSVNRNP